MKRARHVLAPRLKGWTADMLAKFANLPPGEEVSRRFKRRWEKCAWDKGLREEGSGGQRQIRWKGTEGNFRVDQKLVREIWEGKKEGTEAANVAIRLGILPYDHSETGEDVVVQRPPIMLDWDSGTIVFTPRSLNDAVWMTLLQHSGQLGICENRAPKVPCKTQYFIKYRPKQQFCSEACAAPAKREYKRQWWNRERGKAWREKQKKKTRKSRKKTKGKGR